jgi:hypothetical protein
MILFHGSTEIVENPIILKGTHFLDFGFGFYTTTSEVQAVRWAEIKKKRTRKEMAYLSFYNPTQGWLEFVIGNRRGQITHEFDFVKGPVANDTLYLTFSLYESGVLSLEETVARLKVHELFDQLSFHTERALANLMYIETKNLKEWRVA